MASSIRPGNSALFGSAFYFYPDQKFRCVYRCDDKGEEGDYFVLSKGVYTEIQAFFDRTNLSQFSKEEIKTLTRHYVAALLQQARKNYHPDDPESVDQQFSHIFTAFHRAREQFSPEELFTCFSEEKDPIRERAYMELQQLLERALTSYDPNTLLSLYLFVSDSAIGSLLSDEEKENVKESTKSGIYSSLDEKYKDVKGLISMLYESDSIYRLKEFILVFKELEEAEKKGIAVFSSTEMRDIASACDEMIIFLEETFPGSKAESVSALALGSSYLM